MKEAINKIHFIKGLAEGLRDDDSKRAEHVTEVTTLISDTAISVLEKLNLSFIRDAITSSPGGNTMLDFITLDDGQYLVISNDNIYLYPSWESFIMGKDDLTISRRERKQTMYLLFGKDVCDSLQEDGIDEACRLIEDGAEFQVVKSLGGDLKAVLDHLDTYGAYVFIKEEEYNKIIKL
jgi:hypothetical protein